MDDDCTLRRRVEQLELERIVWHARLIALLAFATVELVLLVFLLVL